MAADELFGPDGTQAFSLDGMQVYGMQAFGLDEPRQPSSAAFLGDTVGDALGGLVTGPAFEPGDWSGEPPTGEPDSVYATGNTPFPAAPDQQQLRSAVDKAMMTGPPTTPLRISRPTALQRVRPAPTVTTASTLNFEQAPITAPFPQLDAPLPQLAPPLPAGSRATPAPTAPPTPAQSPVPRPTRSTRLSSSSGWPQQTARPLRPSLAGRPSLRSQHPAVSALLKLVVPIIFVVLILLLHGFGGTLSGLFQ